MTLSSARRVGELLSAMRGYDQRAVREILDHAETDLGLPVSIDDVVLPTLRLIGTLWAGGTLDIAQEHAFSVTLRRWLHRRIDQHRIDQDRPADTGPREPRLVDDRVAGEAVVLVAAPDNQHTLSLDCLELLLTRRGVDVVNLCDPLPLDTLRTACAAIRPAAVVVVSHDPTTALRSAHATQALNDDGWTVYYAGAAFASQATRSRTAGTPLDDTLSRSADHLCRRHHRASRTSDPHPQPAN